MDWRMKIQNKLWNEEKKKIKNLKVETQFTGDDEMKKQWKTESVETKK